MNTRFPVGGRACRVPSHVFAAWLLVSAASAWSASPQLNGFAPFGGQRGTQVQIEFQGARLGDAQEVMFYEPGISVAELVAAPASVKATLTIAPDCRLGLHGLRIRSASGLSNLRVFSVGAMKDVAEVEPNNDFTKPQRIELDVTVNGVINNEDVDYFLFEAKKGERISVEVVGLRLGSNPGAFFDPAVAILDRDRFEVASCDDAPLLRQDPACGLLVPEDGQYVVQIRETAFNGNGNCKYRAHVGHFPRPTSVCPLGGKLGESLEVRWLGDIAGERTEKVQLSAEPLANFGLYAHDNQGVAPTANPFRLSEFGNALEVEPNDEPAQATVLEIPGAANGIVSKPGDIDRFKFAAKKGQTLDVRVFARSLGSPLDSVITVHRANKGGLGGTLGTNDDSGGPDSFLRINVPEDDDYFLEIRDQLRSGGLDYAYRVEIAPIKPSLTMGLPERVQYNDTTITVPKGNRLAVMLSAQRTDFSGDLQFEFKDLPPGIAVEVLPMPGNRSETVMLFTAAADAPLGGSLVDVVGRTTDPKQPIEGHLRLRSSLARGQNQVEMWSYFADRTPLVVTEESPFTIDIVEPKVPLVRSGAMELKVVAKRKEGFTGPIAVKMLYNPPGVSSPTSVSIPEGQNEVLLPLTATAAADLQTWQIIALGEATIAEGQVLASTGFVNLEVAESYLAFTFQAATVEQGQETELVVKMEKRKDFEGSARVELVGMPNGATSEPIEITKDSSELEFKVKTIPTATAGRHKTLLARVVITEKGEPVTHMLGPGDLRIDTPLPPKSNAAPAAAGTPKPAATAASDKRLNRLEKLRKEREQARTEPEKKQ